MGVRVGLLFLLVLGIGCMYTDARSLVISDSSVVQINYEDLNTESKIPGPLAKNEKLCTLCEQFTSQAVEYLNENKTQTEIINGLHLACSKLHSLHQQCVTLVDYYAPLFFSEIATIQPENFCKKVNLCEDMAVFLPQQFQDSCTVCHNAVAEVLMKLKDPDTQLEIIELLLKACGKVESYVKECKKLVFEYGPLILINAEQFLEDRDVCVAIHVCKKSSHEEATMAEMPLIEMVVSSENS
ncbi:uncharacterized protein LOC131253534 [Magnolia sinica]|uniref:uncharacterized protein LOC131253534 n=1 Tax=Magnolia sinica TaxID=86752 RepID=UPI002658B7D9|nr:uncharacterized protein LOC131253534 [Magnolia sinica]XP_058110549.1 uncharacterized protein LOC131253534 [Magnolia sinica]